MKKPRVMSTVLEIGMAPGCDVINQPRSVVVSPLQRRPIVHLFRILTGKLLSGVRWLWLCLTHALCYTRHLWWSQRRLELRNPYSFYFSGTFLANNLRKMELEEPFIGRHSLSPKNRFFLHQNPFFGLGLCRPMKVYQRNDPLDPTNHKRNILEGRRHNQIKQ